MLKYEKEIIEHLKPITSFADTYFLCVCKYTSHAALENRYAMIEDWVHRNKGIIRKTAATPYILGDEKGYTVKIIFPAYSEKKQIMAECYKKAI